MGAGGVHPGRPEATVNRAGYVFCVLELFHQWLRHRDIFALTSGRWADPRAQLLADSDWEAARGTVLNALQLPGDPDSLLAEHARDLDTALRHVAGFLIANTEVHIDDQGRLHAGKIDAVPDPPSLTDLRRRCEGMLPRVDISEVVLEVPTSSTSPCRRDAYLPALATSVNNLAIQLRDAGQREQAFVLEREASAHYHELAATNPEVFGPAAEQVDAVVAALGEQGNRQRFRLW